MMLSFADVISLFWVVSWGLVAIVATCVCGFFMLKAVGECVDCAKKNGYTEVQADGCISRDVGDLNCEDCPFFLRWGY